MDTKGEKPPRYRVWHGGVSYEAGAFGPGLWSGAFRAGYFAIGILPVASVGIVGLAQGFNRLR